MPPVVKKRTPPPSKKGARAEGRMSASSEGKRGGAILYFSNMGGGPWSLVRPEQEKTMHKKKEGVLLPSIEKKNLLIQLSGKN